MDCKAADEIKDKLVNEIMIINDLRILKIINAFVTKVRELKTVGASNEY